MESFYKRYCNGECDKVWDELISLGDKVRSRAVISDAQSVAREFVSRCRKNLLLLHARLQEIGYQFASPENALREPTKSELEQLDVIERKYGTLPIILRAWYETFGSVDFRQSSEQLQHPDGIKPQKGPAVYGLGSHPVIVFVDLNESLKMNTEFDKERVAFIQEAKKNGYYDPEMEKSEPFLPLGGWASNCEPKGFILPDHKFDGVIYNDGSGDMYFAYELRNAFRWGGFPFWSHSLKNRNFYSPFEYKPNFEKLAPDLQRDLTTV